MMRFHNKLHFVLAATFAVCFSAENSSADQYSQTHRCDEVAAHPEDAGRFAAGVTDSDLVPGLAIAACSEALSAHPDTVRFQFQLGRAQWAAKKYHEAMTPLLAAAGKEYGPAFAYVADIYGRGLGGVTKNVVKSEDARARARKLGFEAEVVITAKAKPMPAPAFEASPPAAAVENSFSTGAEQPIQPKSERPFDASMFVQKRAMAALFSGNLKDVAIEGVGQTIDIVPVSDVLIYLLQVQRSFEDPVNQIRDPNCLMLSDPTLVQSIQNRVMNQALGGAGLSGSREQQSMAGLQIMGNLLQQMASGGMGNLVQQSANTDTLKKMGDLDGKRLINGYGCSSNVTKTIQANLKSYVRR